jgi:predicted TIM-barrel fold metal-dependent hydrolase
MSRSVDCHFDAHCHIFDIHYLIREIGHMLRDAVDGDYPHHKPTGDLDFPESPTASISGLLHWISELVDASHGGEEENLDMVAAAGAKAHGDELPIKVIPLMMDVYFMLAEPVLQGEFAPIRKRKKDRLRQWLTVRDAQVDKKIAALLRKKNTKSSEISRILSLIKPRLLDTFLDAMLSLLRKSPPYFDSRGFRFELEQMRTLSLKRPGSIYPFLAVDPRRTGLIDSIIKAGQLVGKGKPFAGIKLYPRLGYHPQCADLMPLYRWCEKHKIPIVSHCDQIGFPPPELEKILHIDQGDFGNPIHFEKVLTDFPDLIIDFAHFGMSNPTWANQISTYMGKYPNVYSDLACYTTSGVVDEFYQTQWHKPKVAERTLFGTDFDVMYFVTPGITLDIYYRNFMTTKAFSPEEIQALTCHNPKRFLGIE